MTALYALTDSYRTGLLVFIAWWLAICGYCVWEELQLRKEMRE